MTRSAYSLVRFSTGAQELGSSQARQIERAKAECERRGWTFDAALAIQDLGVSAFRGKNFQAKYALGKFIEASKRGLLRPSPVLVVENPDRFSRDVLDSADSELWGLVKRGVDVLFLSNGLLLTKGDENDPAKRAILMFEFHRSNGESKRKSDLVTAAFVGKRAAAKAGKHVQLGNWQPRWVDFVGAAKGEGKFALNRHAATVRRVVDSYLSGVSMFGVACQLNRDRVPCIGRGKRWSQGNVRYLLASPLLIGTVKNKGEQIAGYYPPVVSAEEWDRLIATINRNTVRRGGSREGERVTNLFRNRCECAACGGKVGSRVANKPGYAVYRYYQCQEHGLGLCSSAKMLPIHSVEQDFFALVLGDEPSVLISRQDKQQQSKIAAAQARIAALDAQVAAAVEMIGVVPEVRAKLAALQTEREAAKQALADLSRLVDAQDGAPMAIGGIRAALAGLSGVEMAADSQGVGQAIVDAARALETQLQNDETRKKLLGLIPGLVAGLVIDCERGRYRVRALSGELGEWRDVA